MRWYYNLKISAKLIVAFLVLAIIAGVVGTVGVVSLNQIREADNELFEGNTMGLNYTGDASVYFQKVRYNALRMTVVEDVKQRDESIDKTANYITKVDNYLDKYNSITTGNKNSELFEAIKQQWNDYKTLILNSIELAKIEKNKDAQTIIFGDATTIATDLQNAFNDLYQYNSDEAKKISIKNAKTTDRTITAMIIIAIAGVLIAIILGLWIARIFSRPINSMVKAANIIATGDIEAHANVSSTDEIGDLYKAIKAMVDNIRYQAGIAKRIADGDMTVEVNVKSEKDILGKAFAEIVEKNNEVLSNIVSSSEQVAVGSKQVSDSSIALSQGATEQASSVQELTASLEEISSQTKLNAENANKANELAETAKVNAVQGNVQMKEMLKSMEDINLSSANIYKIIKVIDDIAFQTNILALNAAVEAARAGQHGKGFAVVAEEVRNLAARSANAAKETSALIEGSIRKTEDGTKIAKQTAEELNRIVNDIEKVAALVNDIAIASNEQASGIGQINQGIIQVSQVVQNNSATSEETAAASEELSSQAEVLKDMVSRYKLKRNTKSNRRFDDISPEVLRMLENMTDKRSNSYSGNSESYDKSPIILSDNEFGKY